jgi:6-phosphogluconolactonase
MVANYYSGTITAYPLKPNGSIGASTFFSELKGGGPDKERQDMAHAHEMLLSPDNRFVIVPDLGSDKLWVYSIDPSSAKLTPAAKPFTSVPAGYGPRHIMFHPNGKWAYSLSELSGMVTGFTYDTPTGALTPFQSISALAPGFKEHNQSAEIQIHPNGRFLYASNRGPDTLCLFLIDPVTGRLTAGERMSSGGKEPRNFVIDPTGTYLLSENQISGDIVTFRIDQKTGHLTPTGDKVQVSQPVDIVFLPEE